MIFHKLNEWESYFGADKGAGELSMLYPGQEEQAAQRYAATGRGFTDTFGDKPFACISAPGRTELSGNHTDHQRGRVLAAAVTLDILAAVRPTDDGSTRIMSEGYGMIELNAADTSMHPDEKESTEALVRGMLAGIKGDGGEIGGFEAYISSGVPQGSGLSSSAAIEVLLGNIISSLYNGGSVTPVRIAQLGQYAENEYFGKPCGLMDQMASSVGGVISIDFLDRDNPVVESVPFGAIGDDYSFCIVNAGGSHANLTPEYAAIPADMKAVAAVYGKDALGDTSHDDFFNALPTLRGDVGDRAILRAIHFHEENDRVPRQADALRRGDIAEYMRHMLESGYSSFTQLQNIYPISNTEERSVALALAMSRRVLSGVGAWRVHGGGFAGTIQALVPKGIMGFYMDAMNRAFGEDSCYPLQVRPVGGYTLAMKE